MWPWISLALLLAWGTALVLVWGAERRSKAAIALVGRKEAERARLEQEAHWFRVQYPERDWYRETRLTVMWPRPPKH
mgnify:CR=1 FL=1